MAATSTSVMERLDRNRFRTKVAAGCFFLQNDDKPGDGYGSFAVSVVVNRQNVRFYIYDANKGLLDTAALDQEGEKPVPQMCMTCHGGSYNPVTNRAIGASFLPFDLSNFIFSSDPAFTRSAQEDKFRELNALVKLANPNPTSAVAEMIDSIYIRETRTFLRR